MAFINTGYARNKTLTVTKGPDAHYYDLCAGFEFGGTTYPSLSDDGLAQLTDGEYERRRAEFISLVYSIEPGLQTDCPEMTVGSVEYDTTLCPINTNP